MLAPNGILLCQSVESASTMADLALSTVGPDVWLVEHPNGGPGVIVRVQ